MSTNNELLDNLVMKRKLLDLEQNSSEETKKVKTELELGDVVSSIKQRLKEEENEVSALKEFIKQAQMPSGFVEEYLKTSPECKEIFNLFGIDGRPSPEKISLIWETFEAILTKLSQHDDDNKLFHSIGSFIVNKILQNQMKLLYSSLSNNASHQLSKSVLTCMTLMLAQGLQSVKEFLSSFDFSLKCLKAIAKRRDRKQKPDTRTCFVRFCLAFFVFGDVSVIKKILEEKGLGLLILNDLHLDSTETITVVLKTLIDKVVDEPNLLKKTKLLFFNPIVLSKMTILCKHNDDQVKNLAINLLTKLCTDMKYGICFEPGILDKLVNPVLLKFLLSIKQQAQQQEILFQLTTDTLKICHDIALPYLNALNLQMEPRNSAAWFINAKFVIKLLQESPLSGSAKKAVLLKNAMPNIITRMQITTGLKSKVLKVQLYTLDILHSILCRCVAVKSSVLKTNDDDSKEKADEFKNDVIHLLPDVTQVIAIRQVVLSNKNVEESESGDTKTEQLENEIAEEKAEEKAELTCSLRASSVQCLHLYQTLKPGVLTESGYNICKLLLLTDSEETDVGLSLDILLHEVTGIRSWIEKKISSGKNIIQLVVNVMLSWKKNISIVEKAKELFFKILNATGEYEDYHFEVNLWLSRAISCVGERDLDADVLCKQFSECCLAVLNEPFLYNQEMMNIIEENVSEHNQQELMRLSFSPLLFVFFEKTASTEMITQIVIPVMKKLLVVLQHPQHLSELLFNKMNDDQKKLYSEFLFFCDVWLKGMGLSQRQYWTAGHKLTPSSTSDDKDAIDDITNQLISLLSAKDTKTVKHCLKSITGSIEKWLNDIPTMRISYLKVAAMFLRNLLCVLYSSDVIKNSTKLIDILNEKILNALKCMLEYSNESTAEIIGIVGSLSWLSEFKSINRVPLWKSFAEKVWLLFLQSSENVQNRDFCYAIVDNYVNEICDQTTNNADIEMLVFMEKIIPYLDEEKCKDVAQKLVSRIFTQSFQKDEIYLSIFCNILIAVKQRCSNEMNISIDKIDFEKFLVHAIKQRKESLMKLFEAISFFYIPKIDLDTKYFQKLLSYDGAAFTRVAVLLCKQGRTFVGVFMNAVLNDKIVGITDHLLPLVTFALSTGSETEEFQMFVKKIVDDYWDVLLKNLQSNNITEESEILLQLLLPFAPEEMIQRSLQEITEFLHSASMLSQQIISILEYFTKAIFSVSSEKTRSILTYGVLSSVVSLCMTHAKNDLYMPALEYIKVFVKSLHEVPFKTKHVGGFVRNWNDFVKFVLKQKYKDEASMSVLCICLEYFYSKEKFSKLNCSKLEDIHQMIISHSEFLDVMFSENGESKKASLIQVLTSIIKLCPDVCRQSFVPLLMVAYTATLSHNDQQIFAILRHYETNGIRLSSCYPLAWGSGAYEIYKQRSVDNFHLVKEQAWNQLISNLNPKKMMRSSVDFPIHLHFNDENFEVTTEDLYDARFFLPLFVTLLQPGYAVDCRQFIDAGCLSLTLSCLSSHDVILRKMAYHVITLYNDQIETSRFREKNQVTYLLMILKNSVDTEYMRFPSIWTVFLTRYLYCLVRPDQHMYVVLSNLILQKPVMNTKELPVFLPLFNSSTLENLIERTWVLKLLADGLKDDIDYYLYKKYHVLELLLAFYNSHLCDKTSRSVILELMTRACQIRHAAYDLVKKYSILTWIHMGVYKSDVSAKSPFITLLSKLLNTFSGSDGNASSNEKVEKRNSETGNKAHLEFDDAEVEEEAGEIEKNTHTFSSIPRMFPHQVFTICSHLLKQKLSCADKWCVCFMLVNILTMESYFGDLCTWIQNGDVEQILQILEELLLKKDAVNICDVGNLFEKLIMLFSKENVFENLLSVAQWKRIYRVAKRNSILNIVELVDRFTVRC